MSQKCSVSLVLGAGGARGLTHIGVIQWLVENQFEIKSISGSSMGALVGGIYASGKLDVYTQWVCALERIDILKLLDFSFSRASLFKGSRIISVLRELIGDRKIEDLDIAFTAVAADLESGKEVWLNRGSLFDAIHASIAIPTIFAPFEYQGKKLIDGSLVNPIPIAPTLNDSTDITVAVNLSGRTKITHTIDRDAIEQNQNAQSYQNRIHQFIESLQKKRPEKKDNDALGFFDIISQSIEIMQNTMARFRLAGYRPDFVIDIPSNICAFYEFHRAKELIGYGHKKADAILKERMNHQFGGK